MANQYETITQIKIFKNDGVKVGGNNKWRPYVSNPDKSEGKPKSIPGDVILKGDTEYYISMFENDDGRGWNVKIQTLKNARDPNKVYDKITDGISQPGMRQLGDIVEDKHKSIEDLDNDKKDPLDEDEIPF